MTKLTCLNGVLLLLLLATFSPNDCIAKSEPDERGSKGAGQSMTSRVTIGKRKDALIEMVSKRVKTLDQIEIYEPGASFIKVHFSQFKLPPGLTVEVSSPDGNESYRYSRGKKGPRTFDRNRGDNGVSSFSAMSISGDTAIVRILGNKKFLDRHLHRLTIDYYMQGYSELVSTSRSDISKLESNDSVDSSNTESTCGVNERYDAACWRDSNPNEFDRSRPVAKLLIDGTDLCTAWRVGPDNHLFTNNHCIGTQSETSNTEVWFNYQRSDCGYSDMEPVVKVTASTLLATDWTLDFSLFTVGDFAAINSFGYLGLEVREGILGEEIYIPQHGMGFPKQISLESDMNVSGVCEIDDDNHDARQTASDLGYFCDTTGGASGAPVIASSSHRVIAIHHYGNCLNSGVKMSLIWPRVEEFFDGVVPVGDDGDNSQVNLAPNAAFVFDCNDLSCNFDAGASSDPDGEISTHDWNFGDGSTGGTGVMSHTFTQAGDYVVQLTVEDDSGDTDTTQELVSVTLSNETPTAAFSVNCTDLSCVFDASLSSDQDGQIVSYSWDLGDGSTVETAATEVDHTYAQDGNYTVQLTITDNQGAQASAQSTISVAAAVSNMPPAASFEVTCTELSCEFDASSSHDPDGQITEFWWNFGDSESSESGGPIKQYDYTTPGDYSVTLQVVDNMGNTDSHSDAVHVESPAVTNEPPVAAFDSSCDGQTCTFDATASFDPDSDSISYGWQFGDNQTGQGKEVTHTYSENGDFIVVLLVTDSMGASDESQQLLTIDPAGPVDPQIELTAYGTKDRGKKSATLIWSGTTGAEVDIYRDGSLLQTVVDTGEFLDDSVRNPSKQHQYRVCEMDSELACSIEVSVSF